MSEGDALMRQDAPGDGRERRLVAEILRTVRQIRYGSVEIVIHDSRVVQIERREKLRFDRNGEGDER